MASRKMRVELLANPFCMAERDYHEIRGLCEKHHARMVVYDLWNQGPMLLLSLVYLLVGAFVGFLRLRDRLAFLFATVFLGISIWNFTPWTVPLLVVWPRWLQVWLIAA
jgi:hypothetical protein